MKRLRGLGKKAVVFFYRRILRPEMRTIQVTTALYFTAVAVTMVFIIAMILYKQFAYKSGTMQIESTNRVLNQSLLNLEDYLRSMRRISDTVYYSVIKDKELSETSIDSDMGLLYEANKDSIISIACFNSDGELMTAIPNNKLKGNAAPKEQDWFKKAMDEVENLHFSTPHVENLYDDPSYRYYWVVSLSRAIELTRNGRPEQGMLLVDMNYSRINELLSNVNNPASGEYIYLMDGEGRIIYHPKNRLIASGIYKENNLQAVNYIEGVTNEVFNGEERIVISKSVSYTGWKLIAVVPMSTFRLGFRGIQLYAVLMVSLGLLAIIIINQLVSYRIALPLGKLDRSVRKWEAGDLKTKIYIGGNSEVVHLGRTMATTLAQLRKLMTDIVIEQEQKRKSELDALQSQINPHFLYNTLESIVWMIEGERYKEAVYMVTELSSLFRISLSKGKTIIRIADEVKHATNYMNIQKIRYKNSFSINFDIAEDILECCTVKLVLQPLLENAIYYGVEGMDGDGEIEVRGYRKDYDVYLEVTDNGMGMPENVRDSLLSEEGRQYAHGSGVGVINVHRRIQIRFGEEYGLEIESEPDEGTTMRIHLPYALYSTDDKDKAKEGRR